MLGVLPPFFKDFNCLNETNLCEEWFLLLFILEDFSKGIVVSSNVLFLSSMRFDHIELKKLTFEKKSFGYGFIV